MKRLLGCLELPGDKSLAHRMILFTLLGQRMQVSNLPRGLDVLSSLQCVQALGVQTSTTGSWLTLELAKKSEFLSASLDCGNSGTTMRLLCGLLAHCPGNFTLSGDSSLSRRPMDRVSLPLRVMGMNIESTRGVAPIFLDSRMQPQGGDFNLEVPSAQVKSALLLALLASRNGGSVRDVFRTRDHTENMLMALQAPVTRMGEVTVVQPISRPLKPLQMHLPADPSSAAFFGVLAALLPGSDLLLQNLLLNPARIGWLQVLTAAGAQVDYMNPREVIPNENCADVRIRAQELKAMDTTQLPASHLIDEIPILALAATQAQGTSRFANVSELRVKESDRLQSIVTNLSRMGANVWVERDDLMVQGPTSLKAAELGSFADHRIAMVNVAASLLVDSPMQISGLDCIDVSFPGFTGVLQGLLH